MLCLDEICDSPTRIKTFGDQASAWPSAVLSRNQIKFRILIIIVLNRMAYGYIPENARCLERRIFSTFEFFQKSIIKRKMADIVHTIGISFLHVKIHLLRQTIPIFAIDIISLAFLYLALDVLGEGYVI